MDRVCEWRSGSGSVHRVGYCGKLQNNWNHFVCVERSFAIYQLLIEYYGRERGGNVGSSNEQCNDDGCAGKTDCSYGE